LLKFGQELSHAEEENEGLIGGSFLERLLPIFAGNEQVVTHRNHVMLADVHVKESKKSQ
jgi:hypothetical protein